MGCVVGPPGGGTPPRAGALTAALLGVGGGPPRGPHRTKGFSHRDAYN